MDSLVYHDGLGVGHVDERIVGRALRGGLGSWEVCHGDWTGDGEVDVENRRAIRIAGSHQGHASPKRQQLRGCVLHCCRGKKCPRCPMTAHVTGYAPSGMMSCRLFTSSFCLSVSPSLILSLSRVHVLLVRVSRRCSFPGRLPVAQLNVTDRSTLRLATVETWIAGRQASFPLPRHRFDLQQRHPGWERLCLHRFLGSDYHCFSPISSCRSKDARHRFCTGRADHESPTNARWIQSLPWTKQLYFNRWEANFCFLVAVSPRSPSQLEPG